VEAQAPRRTQPVSVIVPCRDAAETLGDQLAALAGQDHRGPLEVIVADNGSVDGSVAVATAWAERWDAIRVVDASQRPGSGHARTRGAAVATGELILSCDADDVADPGWVSAMVRGLDEFDLVGGRLDFAALNPGADLPPVHPDRLPVRFGFLPSASGGNFGIRAEVLRALGGWDEAPGPGTDDLELSWRAQLAGYSLGFVPDAVMRVRMRATTRAAVDQAYGAAAQLASTLRRFRRAGLPGKAIVARGLGVIGHLVATAPLAAISRRRRREWARKAAIAAGFARGALRRSDGAT
jgi:GT2 family glycosyltransferase